MSISTDEPETPPHIMSPPSLRASRFGVAVIFFLYGAVIGTWVSRIPAVQGHIGLSTGPLGLALLGSTVGVLVSMPVAAWISLRTGSRPLTVISALAICLTLPLPALADRWWQLAAALFTFGLGAGVLEVAMNAQAVAVEKVYARPIMSSFHGLWSLGGMAGAAVGGLAASCGYEPLPHFALVGVFLAALSFAVSGLLFRDRVVQGESVTEPAFGKPLRALLGLGLLCLCAMLTEGSMADWSAIYMNRTLGTTAGLAAIGYSAFAACMAGGRFCGDYLNGRMGPVAIARYSGLLAALGLALALAIGQPWAAIVGFGMVGAGIAIVVPLAYTAAGSVPGVAPGPALASVATTGFLGFFAGPPLIGFTAEVLGLRLALALVLVLCAGITLLAPTVAPHRPDSA